MGGDKEVEGDSDINFDCDLSEVASAVDEDELPEGLLDTVFNRELLLDDNHIDQVEALLKRIGLINFLREYLQPVPKTGAIRPLRSLCIQLGQIPPASLLRPGIENSDLLPFTKKALVRILKDRARLPHVSTPADAVRLLKEAENIIVLTGAGISTACGIPDFRSPNGLYAQLEGQYGLSEPQEMFDIDVFKDRPEIFYHFAKQIYPKQFVPSLCHRWIKMLEDKGKLLRNYTQNIDTLETIAGVEEVLNCHGSFKTASCLRCRRRVDGHTIEDYILSQTIPHCEPCRREHEEACQEARRKKGKGKGKAKAKAWEESDEESEQEWDGGPPGIIKPDITFFGENIDNDFDVRLYEDREKVDLLVVIGTSLQVAPVNEVLTHIPHDVPQIFINLDPVKHFNPDLQLLGDADAIVSWLSDACGWAIPPSTVVPLNPSKDRIEKVVLEPSQCTWFSNPVDPERLHVHALLPNLEAQHRDSLRDLLTTVPVLQAVPGFAMLERLDAAARDELLAPGSAFMLNELAGDTDSNDETEDDEAAWETRSDKRDLQLCDEEHDPPAKRHKTADG